jgi:hypothetical protein
MRALDIVKTPKGGIAIITETCNPEAMRIFAT